MKHSQPALTTPPSSPENSLSRHVPALRMTHFLSRNPLFNPECSISRNVPSYFQKYPFSSSNIAHLQKCQRSLKRLHLSSKNAPFPEISHPISRDVSFQLPKYLKSRSALFYVQKYSSIIFENIPHFQKYHSLSLEIVHFQRCFASNNVWNPERPHLHPRK